MLDLLKLIVHLVLVSSVYVFCCQQSALAALDSLRDEPDEDVEERRKTKFFFGPLVCDSNGTEPDGRNIHNKKKPFNSKDTTCFDQIARRQDPVRIQFLALGRRLNN